MAEFEKQDRAARLFKVAQIIGGAGGITARELGERTGTHKRTALRDIIALEGIGVPVYEDGRRWFIREGYFMPAIEFSQPEAVAMLMAGRLAVKHADHNDPVLGMALTKIARAMPEEAKLVARFFEETAGELSAKPRSSRQADVFGVLVRAWLGRRKVRLEYRDAAGKESARVLRPYYLEPASMTGHGTYLIGYDELSREVRSFKVERIGAAELLDTPYYLPADFNLARYLRHSWGIWSKDKIERVVLQFKPAAAGRVRESFWHSSQKLSAVRGGGVRMEVSVRGRVEILPWILSWGADCEVLEPPSLRREVAEVAARMAETYAGGASGEQKRDR
jgi:predicted DNA-binding transcriptional regulator YafY